MLWRTAEVDHLAPRNAGRRATPTGRIEEIRTRSHCSSESSIEKAMIRACRLSATAYLAQIGSS